MELSERCRHLCGHIQTLTGVHAALLDLTAQRFSLPSFHTSCALQSGTDCNAYLTHLYGAYEAERWDGKYILYILLSARTGIHRNASAASRHSHGMLRHHRAVHPVQ